MTQDLNLPELRRDIADGLDIKSSVASALLDRLERAEALINYERRPDDSQSWARLDGAVAWHLIDRHADDWADTGNMMEAWAAARASRSPAVAAVPEDMVLVPIDPPLAMAKAFRDADTNGDRFLDGYAAMIAAAGAAK